MIVNIIIIIKLDYIKNIIKRGMVVVVIEGMGLLEGGLGL